MVEQPRVAHIVALAAQHASGSISLFRLTAFFFISLARMQCTDCGDHDWRNCSAGVAHIVALAAEHASGSISLFRLTAVFYLSAQLFLGNAIFPLGGDNLISFLRPTGAKNTPLFAEGVRCGEGKPHFYVKRGLPLPANHLPFSGTELWVKKR